MNSDNEDPIDAFFKGKIVKNIKVAKPNLELVKIKVKKEPIIKCEPIIPGNSKNVEEQKILTEYLNAPIEDIDDTLGIKEEIETDYKPDHYSIYRKFEFDIKPQILPILSKKDEIIQLIRMNKICLLKADTGTGKSSQVPQYILDDCYRRNIPCNILITQPKKISAESLANRVAFERKCEIGSLIGYQVGLDKRMDANETRILYCTTGVFLQKLVHYKSLQNWTHIIIDEIHERDLDTDMVLLIIRRLMIATKSKTKIILMSATLNCDKISSYFQIIQKPATINLNIKMPYPVKIHYLDELEHLGAKRDLIDLSEPGISRNMFRLGVDILEFFIQKGAGTFLVFLPGIFEIECFQRELEFKREFFNVKNYHVFILHSTIPLTNIKGLYDDTLRNKIVLATNIAESSITIPGIRIIIDYCLTKYLEVDSASSLTQLKLSWASKMNMDQRSGRVGRTSIGQVVRMLYKDQYETLREDQKAEMLRTSLENVVLKTKKLQMGRPSDILAIALDPPKRSAIVDAILMLKEVGALTKYSKCVQEFDYLDGNLTFTGDVMNMLPIDVRLSKLIMLGYVFSVSNECVVIAAGLSVGGSIFQHDSSMTTFETKLSYDSTSDLIAISNAYFKFIEWIKNNKEDVVTRAMEEKFCKEHKFNYKNLKEMTRQIDNIKNRLRQFNIIYDNFRFTTEEKLLAIKMCIAGAFYSNVYTFGGQIPGRDEFKLVCNKNLCSTVYFQTKKSTQNGHLYEDQVREILYNTEVTKCRDDACVTFDTNSQKVFVQFNNLKNDASIKMPGDVKLEVHKALKLKHFKRKNDFEILMMNSADEEQYAPSDVNRNLYNRESVGLDLKLKAKFNIYPSFSLKPEEKGQFLMGEITHIISPSKFYFQSMKAIGLKDKLNSVIGSNLQRITDIDEKIENNRIMILHDRQFKRGQILEFPIKNDKFKVLLIDYGKIVDCTIKDFYTGCAVTRSKRQDIVREFFKISPLCYECRLAEIQPTANQQYGWSKKAIEEFKDIVRKKSIQLDLYAFNVYDKIASVVVYAKKSSRLPVIDVNGKLVNRGLAMYANESYATLISKTLTDNFESMKYLIHKEPNYVDFPKDKLEIRCELLGPFSPIERSGQLENASQTDEPSTAIDQASVNCVLVDSYPYDGVKKVLIASTKSITHRGTVTLRHTTIMPNLKGMASIIALIFGPCGEIRSDKNMSRYTSILTGLGSDFLGKPYYAKHDYMIRVDVDFDNHDIQMINSLRGEMSLLMQQQLNEKFEYYINPMNKLLESRSRACSLLLKIIKKERIQLGEVYSDQAKWTVCVKKEASEYPKMFPIHDSYKLCDTSIQSLKFMIHHFVDLEQKARYNSKDEIVDCLACDERVETLTDLKNHLFKTKHCELKKKYQNIDRDSSKNRF